MDNVDEWVQTVRSLGTSNPFDPSETILHGVGGAEVRRWEDKGYIKSLRSFEHKKGHGTQILRTLLAHADRLGVPLRLDAIPFETRAGRIPQRKLEQWYRKHGFKMIEGEMVRKPLPVSLARGAAVVNHQYYPPGRFLAKALESIESAVARRRNRTAPVQLSGYASGTNTELPVSLASQDIHTDAGVYRLTVNPHDDHRGHVVSFGLVEPDEDGHPMILHDTLHHAGHGAVEVFRQVGNAVHDYIRHNKPPVITFTGAKDRISLYDKMAALLSRVHGYDVKRYDYGNSGKGYRLTRQETPTQLARGPAVPKSAKKYTNRWHDESLRPYLHMFESGDRVGLGALADEYEDQDHPVQHVLRNFAFGKGKHYSITADVSKEGVRYVSPGRNPYSLEPTTPSERKAGVPIARLYSAGKGKVGLSVHPAGSNKVHLIETPVTQDQITHMFRKFGREGQTLTLSDYPTQLARFDKDITLRSETLKPEHIKDLEDAHGVTGDDRLPYTVGPSGTIRTKVEDLHRWFDHIATKQLQKPLTTDEGKIAFLASHFGDAAQQFPNTAWYGKTIKKMEAGFKSAFPKLHPKLAKALVAVTSPNQMPVPNIDTVFRMMKSGLKRNPEHPLLGIPHLNEDALAAWKEKYKPDEKDLAPGHDPVEKLKHAKKWEHVPKEERGYSEEPWWIDDKGVPVIKVPPRKKEGEKRDRPAGWATIQLPSVDKDGRLRAKGWSTASQSIQVALKEMQKVYAERGEKGLIKHLDEKTKGETPLFGPKVGNFYRNLTGDKDLVTKDVWFSRTFNRLLGSLTKKGSGAPRNKKESRLMDHVVRHTAKLLGMTPADLQANLWYYEQNLHRVFGVDSKSQDYAQGVDKAIQKHGLLGRIE